MSDIRDWGKFIRGRWEWSRFDYERGFPRGCQFTDVDAAVEFDGRSLEIEAVHWDGTGCVPRKNGGQRYRLQREAQIPGRTVLIVYGCGCCNNPLFVENVGTHEELDLRGKDLGGRRQAFKDAIDVAMGLWETA